jgi:SAM-dependent methyltransferase
MLPDPKYFEYNGHLRENTIEFSKWRPSNLQFDKTHLNRVQHVIVDNIDKIKDHRILDLGCAAGYLSYLCHHYGAKHVTGVNVRSDEIKVANYFAKQVGMTNYNFVEQDIEEFSKTEELLKNVDTVIISFVLEHIRNPEYLIRLIAKSNVKHLIIGSTIVEDSITQPKLYYYTHDTEWIYNAHDGNRKKGLACCPNSRWLETVLYYHNWLIQDYKKCDQFVPWWFEQENLDTIPWFEKHVYLTSTRRQNDQKKET